MTWQEAALYGVVGGMLPEILALYKLRHAKRSEKPDWLSSGFYWVVTSLMVLLGGATAAFYQKIGVNVNELMAIHLGIATPLLISTATKEKPKVN